MNMNVYAASPAPEVGEVTALATDGLEALAPSVLAIGAAGVVILTLFVAYRMVTTAIRSKGKSVG